MRSFKHIEHTVQTEYDYSNNLFRKALPLRAFTNQITRNFLLGCEQILVIMIQKTSSIKTYFRL